jgi:hypothetical protein
VEEEGRQELVHAGSSNPLCVLAACSPGQRPCASCPTTLALPCLGAAPSGSTRSQPVPATCHGCKHPPDGPQHTTYPPLCLYLLLLLLLLL